MFNCISMFKKYTLVAMLVTTGHLSISSTAFAALVISNLNLSNAGGELQVDVNNDSFNDLLLDVYKDSEYDSGFIQSLTSPESPYNTTGSSNLFNLAMFDSFNINKFNVGDTVGNSWGSWYESGFAYNDALNLASGLWEQEGQWPAIGTTGFMGFSFQESDGIHYGWMEITRGSINIGRIGYQTIAGVGALIPGSVTGNPNTIPEPTTAIMMLLSICLLLSHRFNTLRSK